MNKIQIIAGIKNKKLREQKSRDLCDDCLYKAIREIALKTINKNIWLQQKMIKQLKKNKKLILNPAANTKGNRKRKELVAQSGGYLQIILPALLTALGGLVNGALRKG